LGGSPSLNSVISTDASLTVGKSDRLMILSLVSVGYSKESCLEGLMEVKVETSSNGFSEK